MKRRPKETVAQMKRPHTKNTQLESIAALLLATVALAGLQPANAQPAAETAPVPDRVFVDSLDIEVINIDVYVRDSNGDPVLGLTADDFELIVDGNPAAISNFYSVSQANETESPRPTEPEPEAAEADEPVEAEAEEPPPPPKDQSLLVVVYIDNFNLTPFRRNIVLRELRQFLREELTREDRVMLVTYDRSLHLRHPFTARPENITRAMLELEDISGQRIHHVRERTDILRRIEDAESGVEAMMIAEDFAGSIRNDTSFTLDALRQIVDNLAGSTGRKALVYVSEGLPLIAAQDIFQAVQIAFQDRVSLLEMFHYDMSRQFHELINNANANRVSFYTIDARGITVLSQGTVDSATEGLPGVGQMIDSVNNLNLQSTVQLMAERTGGRATINANRFLPDLRKIGTDFRNYYSLGYTSGAIGDGRYHSFEVKLKEKRRGVTVRHRDGYRSKSVETRMHDGTLSALNLDLQDNPLDVKLDFGRAQPADNGLFDVPFSVRIPYRNLTLIPRGAIHDGKVRLWLAAKDQDDEMSEVQQVPLDLQLSDQDLEANQDYVLTINLTMESGQHSVAVGVRDDYGHQRSFLRQTISLGDRRTGG